MAGGPPSSVDGYGEFGGGEGPPSSVEYGGEGSGASYWEERFGPRSDFDPSAFAPSYTRADKGMALFRLTAGLTLLVVGTYALWSFSRSRWVLDVRARSARLVMFMGLGVLLTMLVSINGAVNILWDSGLDWFWTSMLLFFITPAVLGSYICRALRLAVVFHPRTKRAMPWLIPERNYMAVLLVGCVAMLSIPIYDEYTLEIWEAIPRQTDILAWVSIAFAAILTCIYPFIRKVDDLFNISTELIVVTVAIVLLAFGQKCVRDYGGAYEVRWVGDNLFLFFAAFVFSVSVVDPLRRLAFDPLAATKRNYADRVLLARNQPRSTVRTASGASSGVGGDSEDEAKLETGRKPTLGAAAVAPAVGGNVDASSSDPVATGNVVGRRGRGSTMEVWDFEKLARTPPLAAAFEEFSRKALCHESVLFLREVSRYRDGDYAVSTSSSIAAPSSQHGMFCFITEMFIKAGSMEEVNISDADKKRVLELYGRGRTSFEGVSEQERSMVFNQAYVEVRQMLEANLLRRFLQTDRFKNARAQWENSQAMLDSPQQTGVAAV